MRRGFVCVQLSGKQQKAGRLKIASCTFDDLQIGSSTSGTEHGEERLVEQILAIGLSMPVIGTLSNDKSRASCGFTHHRFMSIGGILCFVHGLFSIAYYVSATAAQ